MKKLVSNYQNDAQIMLSNFILALSNNFEKITWMKKIAGSPDRVLKPPQA